MKERALKKQIIHLLKNEEYEAVLALTNVTSEKRLLNLLVGCFCNDDEKVRWLAVSAVGQVVLNIADADMEEARVVMRRFMWMLNDESGGIGWGAPEAMGEVMACHKGLAEEYTHILVANMREDGNYLELPMLQRGLMWGIARLAEARGQLLREKNAVLYLLPYLDSADSAVRGLACRAVGNLNIVEAKERLASLIKDTNELLLYSKRKFETVTVGKLADNALKNIS